ncbi:hypothetical protein GCM10027020_21060 [Nocardioides salsibiostraticola]
MANSHKQEANARRTPRAVVIAGPLAAFATASAVALGVMASAPGGIPLAEDAVASSVAADLGSVADRGENVSRSASRTNNRVPNAARTQRGEVIVKLTKADKILDPAATKKALAKADSELFTTGVLNIWTHPGKKGKNLGEIDAGKPVVATGRNLYGRDEIVFRDKSRWVTEGYLSPDEPVEPTEEAVEGESAAVSSGGSCTNGTSTTGGSNVQAVHNLVCGAFPEISTYGGLRGGGGDHGSGRAVDIMVSGSRGQQVADFVRANASALGVSYVIYAQQIWSVERGGEGWRGMSSRGSTTANHYDHVHVSTY